VRIVIDCRCVFAGCGGIGRYARHLTEALARVNDYDQFAVLRSEQRSNGLMVTQPNFRELPVPAAMLDAGWEQMQLPSLLEEMGADLYHNPTFAVPVVRVCRQVATIHDVVFRDRPDLVQPSLREYLDRATSAAVQAADRIITVSEHSRQRLGQVYRVEPSKVDVTPEAADPRFRPLYGGARETEFRKRFGIEGPYLLYVGSLEPKKNIDNLLAAFVRAKREHDLPHVLVLAGGGGGMPYDAQEAAQAFGADGSVVITGYLPEDLLPYAYNAADAFIYPSLYEGFGLPPLEAMACGTPTIVSHATSLPEVVGEGALLVDPEDVAAMAEAMGRLVGDPELRSRLSERGLERAGQFSWQATALRTLGTYRRAAA
jgi:glycosyltransferase involved in cell wall biosynthesis